MSFLPYHKMLDVVDSRVAGAFALSPLPASFGFFVGGHTPGWFRIRSLLLDHFAELVLMTRRRPEGHLRLAAQLDGRIRVGAWNFRPIGSAMVPPGPNDR
jgi:hypothetical protein